MSSGEKGICRLSIMPVRAKHSDKSEMVTQLLFGDHYEVTDLSEDEKWLKIRLHFDGYEGWIDVNQHNSISEAYYEQINNSDYKICTDLTSSILYKKHHITIVLGSILPISTNEIFKIEEQLAFNGESKSLSQKRDFEFLKQVASKYLNAPYQWGGRSPFGIDCSGFTQNVYRICGYKLPRDSSQQINSGQLVENLDHAHPGDLAFFKNTDGRVTHVGIIMENNDIIHASGKVRVDKIDNEGIYNEDSNLHTHRLSAIKRIFRE